MAIPLILNCVVAVQNTFLVLLIVFDEFLLAEKTVSAVCRATLKPDP